MKHYSEDELTLYYYGEGRRRADVERHLDGCAECAKVYREIAGTLAMIAAPELPERGDQYGLEVWQRIRHRLPEQDGSWFGQWFRWDRLALAALSPLERAAFTLRHYEGRSIDEISAALNLGTSAAKHSVFRAVKKLRLALAPLRSLES